MNGAVMAGSEEVAWTMYARLGERDRAAVDAWRALGNDLVSSLLNADALSRERPRRFPSDDLDPARAAVPGRVRHL